MLAEVTLPSPHLGQHANTRHILLYFLPGNPGYIAYYVPFFARLRTLLNAIEAKHAHKPTFTIAGRTSPGFDDADHAPPFNTSTHPPYNVDAQIQHALKHLHAANAIPAGAGPARQGQPYDDVVLMGHSLGTYIALELFHRHLHEHPAPALHLKAGILLFATIAHLAKSPQGVYLDAIRRTPLLGRYLHVLLKAGLALLPARVIRWFAAAALRMPPHAAETTTEFLASRDGLHQALYLGMDEMAVISEERWADELWEVAGREAARAAAEEAAGKGGGEVVVVPPHPKFFILFGKEDKWVANECRDRFIAERAAHKAGRTRIVVDEEGLPHDFCINHSETVAEKVAVWVDEIAEHS